MFMGFWYCRWEWWEIILKLIPPYYRDICLQNLRNIYVFFDFSIFDALDACLMVHGSWLKAHGSWPREARGSSWLMARGQPGPGDPKARGAGPGPGARFWVPRAGPAPGHEP